jgi:CBS domain-containing protein
MEVGTVCRRLVFTVRRSDEVSRAAQLMREKHTDYLVVVEHNPLAHPVGVLTDRDVVIGALARGVDPKTLRVGDIMTPDIITARESESIGTALQRMRDLGFRRLPIVNDRYELVGVLFMEDLLKVILSEAQQIVNLVRSERENDNIRRAEQYIALRRAAAMVGTGSHRS